MTGVAGVSTLSEYEVAGVRVNGAEVKERV